MAFLAELQSKKSGLGALRPVPQDEKKDRSSANVRLSGKDVLEDEAERWKYFFDSGCEAWFDKIKDHTFRSSFVELKRNEAQAIVDHWEARRQAGVAAENPEALRSEQAALEEQALHHLASLTERLDEAVRLECAASPVGLAFVKLSTRSPKDSRHALAKAEAAYRERLAQDRERLEGDDNARWKILSEEVARAGASSSGREAMRLLLDSERVFEDLEYALRGPKAGGLGSSESLYGLSLVARAWDPRLKLQSEFRGIAWNGKLTCLCQYFHPLFFEELEGQKQQIQDDCLALFATPAVAAAVDSLGGHCIIDFAWLAPGEVLIVELNPFDGVCLGTFPASTGLFLWDDEDDQRIMCGDAPFKFRTRTEPLSRGALKGQCNPDWRRIIYDESQV